MDHGDRKRKWVRVVQRYLLNPPVKAAVWAGLVPGLVLVETTGRHTGARRRNVVGMHLEGTVGWVVAEQGRHAGYVRNIESDPRTRVRIRRRWQDARATVAAGDDAQARLDSFGRKAHASAVRRFGTDLTSVRFDFASSRPPGCRRTADLDTEGGRSGRTSTPPVLLGGRPATGVVHDLGETCSRLPCSRALGDAEGLASPAVPVWLIAPCHFDGLGGVATGAVGCVNL